MAAIPISTSFIQQQADELDPKKRAAMLDKMQQLVYDKAMYAPIWQLGFLNGVGPRVGEVVLRPDPGLCLHRAVRGSHAEIGLSRNRAPHHNREELWGNS